MSPRVACPGMLLGRGFLAGVHFLSGLEIVLDLDVIKRKWAGSSLRSRPLFMDLRPAFYRVASLFAQYSGERSFFI